MDGSVAATGWTQPSPPRARLLLTHKGPPGKSHHQRHHDAGRLEPSLDTGRPCAVWASEVKRLDEPAEGRNGKDCSWREILPGSGGVVLPCSPRDSSAASSHFCNGPGVSQRHKTPLASFLWPLAKLYLGGAQNINIPFVFQTSRLTRLPKTRQGWRGEHFPLPVPQDNAKQLGCGSLFEARSQLQEVSLIAFSKADTVRTPHVFEEEKGNSGRLTRAIDCSVLPAQAAPGKIYSQGRFSSCLTLPFHIHPPWLQLQ